MVHRVIRNTTSIPETITADAGYWDTTSVRDAFLAGILLVAPEAEVWSSQITPPLPLPEHLIRRRCGCANDYSHPRVMPFTNSAKRRSSRSLVKSKKPADFVGCAFVDSNAPFRNGSSSVPVTPCWSSSGTELANCYLRSWAPSHFKAPPLRIPCLYADTIRLVLNCFLQHELVLSDGPSGCPSSPSSHSSHSSSASCIILGSGDRMCSVIVGTRRKHDGRD